MEAAFSDLLQARRRKHIAEESEMVQMDMLRSCFGRTGQLGVIHKALGRVDIAQIVEDLIDDIVARMPDLYMTSQI
jgi:hypothetical protein